MREIVVVRREDEFSRTLAAKGFSVLNCPVIRTEALDDLSELEQAVSRIDTFDGVFITSPAAAEPFVRRASDHLNTYRGRVFILGRQSFRILKQTAASLFFDERANTVSAMLGLIGEAELRGKRFLFVRGDRSMRTVSEHLNGIGDVEEVVVYRTVNIDVGAKKRSEIRDKAARGEIAMTCFFSPSAVESFLVQFGIGPLRFSALAAIGETTSAALRSFGLCADVVASSTDTAHFAADVLKYLTPTGKGV